MIVTRKLYLESVIPPSPRLRRGSSGRFATGEDDVANEANWIQP